MKPATYKKTNEDKKMRVCKLGSAKIAIGKIEKNTDTFILTYGQFSLIDGLMAILDQTGPAHVAISTWTAAHAHLDKSAELLSSANILSFRMVVDDSFKSRQPKYFEHMIELFGLNSIRQMRTHAKFMVIHNDEWDIVVRTSMNLNENPRLENIEISEKKDFADFFLSIMDNVFQDIGPGESPSVLPKLNGLIENPIFKPVQGEFIKRSNLKEVEYTYELTRRGKSKEITTQKSTVDNC
jgi:hypothetical protein